MRTNKAWLLVTTVLVLLSITGCNILKSASPSNPVISQTDVSTTTTASPETSTSAAILTGTPSAITPAITGSVTSTPEIKTIVIDKPIPATYTTYTDPNGLFTISYPADWVIREDNKQSILDTSNAVTRLENGIPDSKFGGGLLFGARTTLNPYAEFIMVFLPLQSNPTPVHSPSTSTLFRTSVGGREAMMVEDIGPKPDSGEKMKGLTVQIVIDRNTWRIEFTARPEDYKNWENDFRSIAGSLRILKSRKPG
jgi:hypothetical protein